MTTSQKCAHKGCGKIFTDPNEDCVYHPGPPEFHEGQKGWKCCKPRVLTFDEFLEIPPCTTGKHSTVDENAEAAAAEAKAKKAAQEQKDRDESEMLKRVPISQPKPTTPATVPATSAAIATPTSKPSTPVPDLEEDSDDPDTPIPPSTTCKRRACGKSSKDFHSSTSDSAAAAATAAAREDKCTFHPGVPIFHEGSKGWTCCKRRVLEFDEFMKIEGCKTRTGHCFVGKRSKAGGKSNVANSNNKTTGSDTTRTTRDQSSEEGEEILQEVRNDFYQTPNKLIVSFYLKKIDKERAVVTFKEDGSGVQLDLPTSDGKRFRDLVETWREIVPSDCESKIMGTKLEMVLVKAEGGVGWPVLRKGDRDTGERIQVGRAGRA